MNAHKDIRVLIVEDDVLVAEMVQSILEELAYHIAGMAVDGQQAIEMTKRLHPDVILMDIGLPDISGLEVTQHIYKTNPTPVVVLTAYDNQPELVRQASMVGAGAYLIKPPNTREVERAITITMARFDDMMRLRQRTAQLAVLNHIASVSNATLNLDNLLQIVYQEITSVFQCDAFFIALYDKERDELNYRVQVDREVQEPPTLRPKTMGLTSRVIESKQPLLIRDLEKEQEQLPSPELWGTMKLPASWLGVPMKTGERVTGVISLQAYRLNAYGQDEQLLLSTIADQVAIAVENARLYQEAQQRTAHLEALNTVIAAGASVPDLSELLDVSLDRILWALGLEAGAIWLTDQRAVRNLEPEAIPTLGQAARAAKLNPLEPIIVEDWQEVTVNRQGPVKALADDLHIRASLSMPLRYGGHRIGGLHLVSSSPRAWHREELAVIKAIGQQLGAAAERLRLFRAEQEHRELAQALESAAAAVSSTLHFEQVLDRILENVERVVDADAFSVLLIENGKARIVRWRSRKPLFMNGKPQVPRMLFPMEHYNDLITMIETGDPMIIYDTATDPNWLTQPGWGWVRAHLGVPIQVSGTTVGFLSVDGAQPGQFGSEEAQRLQAFAGHAAAAIENARLHRELLNYMEQLEQRVQERTSQLQAQYAQLEAILDSVSDSIVVTDAMGTIIQDNPVTRTWLNQTLSPQEVKRVRARIRDLTLKAEERPEAILELEKLDLKFKAAPIASESGEQGAAVIAIHDVSKFKALDRMKTRFVTNVSHGLRTPVTTIKLYAHLMKKRPEKWQEYLGYLTQEAEHQAQLVQNILDISRIDAGQLELQLQPTQLNSLTEEAMSSWLVLAQNRNVSLLYTPAASDIPVKVDAERIKQALDNLLENALLYTPAGGSVTISTGREEIKATAWATMTVSDTGMGIPDNELPHIFERFFRGVKPQAMQIPGTGLGLAIAWEIAGLHQGRLTVTSEDNVGSTFTLWLPIATEN